MKQEVLLLVGEKMRVVFFIFELKVAKGKYAIGCSVLDGGAASRVLWRMRGFQVMVNRRANTKVQGEEALV